MKILVTGTSGYIGGYLLKEFPKLGLEVVPFDRSRLKMNSDVTNQTFRDIDAVIHCAGIAHTKLSNDLKTKIIVYDANVRLTNDLCQIAISSDVKHFIFLSSAKVYGPFSDHSGIFRETDQTFAKDLYAQSKLEAEKSIEQQLHSTNTSYTILRLPLTYGHQNKANMRKLERLVQLGIPLPFGGIVNSRSILHIQNLLDALVTLTSQPYGNNEIFNICDNNNVSTIELIDLIARSKLIRSHLFKVNSEILEKILRLFGYEEIYQALWKSFEIDNNKIKSKLDWTPKYNIADMIERDR